MKYKEIMESVGGPRIIDVEHDGGSANGYAVETKYEQLPNWFQKHGVYDTDLVTNLRSKYQTIAFLNNINVDDGERGAGAGGDLYQDFESEAELESAQAIILLADTDESQDDGFDLVTWYTKLDYVTLYRTSGGPIMIKVLN